VRPPENLKILVVWRGSAGPFGQVLFRTEVPGEKLGSAGLCSFPSNGLEAVDAVNSFPGGIAGLLTCGTPC